MIFPLIQIHNKCQVYFSKMRRLRNFKQFEVSDFYLHPLCVVFSVYSNFAIVRFLCCSDLKTFKKYYKGKLLFCKQGNFVGRIISFHKRGIFSISREGSSFFLYKHCVLYIYDSSFYVIRDMEGEKLPYNFELNPNYHIILCLPITARLSS